MRVFNLTDSPITYKGRPIPEFGSLEYPELTFVPDRDKANKSMSFGTLPKGWVRPLPAAEPVVEVKVSQPEPSKMIVEVEVKKSATKEEPKKDQRK